MKLLVGVAGAVARPGARSDEVVAFGPQVGGLVSGASVAAFELQRKELKATCGLSGKVAVSCPVWALALTLPINRTESP